MKTALRQRYTVRAKPDGRWGVYDSHMADFCALSGAPIEWPVPAGAQHWLYLCRVAWGAELVDAPEGWNGR